MAESEVVRQCLTYLELRGIMAWRNNTGKRMGLSFGTKGSGDIIGLLPGGRFLSVECKYGRGKQSSDQVRFADGINANGGQAIVVYSLAELEDKLKGVD